MVDGFAMMPNMSFGQAMSVYAGQNVGAGKVDRVLQDGGNHGDPHRGHRVPRAPHDAAQHLRNGNGDISGGHDAHHPVGPGSAVLLTAGLMGAGCGVLCYRLPEGQVASIEQKRNPHEQEIFRDQKDFLLAMSRAEKQKRVYSRK